MSRTASIALLLALAASPAVAQTALRIGATGEAPAAPDEAVAALTAQATGPDAASVQAKVNAMMAKALAASRVVPGVVATTGSYDAEPQTLDTQPPKTVYQASQPLNLVLPAKDGLPPAAFTDLLGRLQQQGLLLNDLGGDLSPQARQAAQQQAVLAALAQIQAQAAAVAAQLHERMGDVKTLNVNAAPAPGPQPLMAMRAMAAAPAPVAAPGNITVTADVSAEVELTPLPGP